jgi:GT2 family glycosyltransferase
VDLTITIISWNTKNLLRSCLNSVQCGAKQISIEMHVVDNGSSDGSPEMVSLEFPQVYLISNSDNRGFARANNQSWSQARGRYWMLLNSDAETMPEALDTLVAFMDAHPQMGLTTARIVSPDGTPQFCAQPVPSAFLTLFEAFRLHKLLPITVRGRILLSSYWTYDRPIRLGWTWGTALIARREAVEKVGPLSEDFFMYGEDLEWCLRMRRHGWETWFCPQAEVLHHGGQSSTQRWSDANRLRVVWDGFYKALERGRGRASVLRLQAATLFALGIEWLVAQARGKNEKTHFLRASLRYHLKTIKDRRRQS